MNKQHNNQLGDLIYNTRETLGVSTSKLAEQVGAHHSTLADIQTGATRQPSYDMVTRLADALARLVEDRDLRRRLGEEAQAVVDRDFDAAKNVDRLSELLAGLANGSTAG